MTACDFTLLAAGSDCCNFSKIGGGPLPLSSSSRKGVVEQCNATTVGTNGRTPAACNAQAARRAAVRRRYRTMSDEMIIETENAKIEVCDSQSAMDALPIINRIMDAHLKENGNGPPERDEPVTTECNRCRYVWEYTGNSMSGTTCPKCQKWTRLNDE